MSAVLEANDSSGVGGNTASPKIPSVDDRTSEELVLGVVGPVGSGCSKTTELLGQILRDDYGYEVTVYRLSDIIKENVGLLGDQIVLAEAGAKRIEDFQAAGNRLRQTFGKDYLAAKAIEKIAAWRDEAGFGRSQGDERVPTRKRHVHILDSLKHPSELRLLRQTYGEVFWLFGVFAPLEVRKRRLTNQMGLAGTELDSIIRHDYSEREDYGQSVRDTFFQSDLFVRNDLPNDVKLRAVISRLLEVLFAYPVHTPTLEEASMYAAYAEAARSACLSRQVGAAIVSASNELIGLGRNDVPRFKGGLYRVEHNGEDHRCYKWGDKVCHNDREKRRLYQDVYDALIEKGLLRQGAHRDEVVRAIATTEVRSLIEFSRAVHAEMEAIVSVARGGKQGLLGATLYCTTYPCHSCARHILASGIERVVYIEPYPKSLATKLHNDAVSESENDVGSKLVFLQYTGVAPKHVLKLFRPVTDRKTEDGRLVSFNKRVARPAVRVSLDDYATHEKYVVARLSENETKSRGDRQPNLI